jgi:hypothetical protein
MNMFSAYPPPWSPLQVQYPPEDEWAGDEDWVSYKTEHRFDDGDGTVADGDMDGTWSCGYLDVGANGGIGESTGSGQC